MIRTLEGTFEETCPVPGMLLLICREGMARVGERRQLLSGEFLLLQTNEVKIAATQAKLYLFTHESGLAADTQQPLTPAMLQVIGAWESCTLRAPARAMFETAKGLELMALAVETALHPRVAYRYCKSEYDRERLQFARDYLCRQLDFPPTIPELARIAGINEFKLKNGFRELFGEPVHRYLMQYKLNLAREALAEGKKTSVQLAFELGFSSVQHFSKAFRQQFGRPPRRL